MDTGPQQQTSPPLILCIGAPRSGLELLSRCLKLLGFATPDGAAAGPGVIHELLCRDLGISSHTAGSLPHGWQNTNAAQNAGQRIRNLLSRQIETNKTCFLADSFLARIFPLWKDALAELELRPRLFHLIRHPWEVARSLGSTENMDLDRAHVLWLSHVREAQRFCRGMDHVRIIFDHLIADPLTSLYTAINDGGRFPECENGIAGWDTLLMNHVQPAAKHHYAGSMSAADMKRFAAFIGVYDEMRLRRFAAPLKPADAVYEKEALSEDEGFSKVMLHLLGRCEARDYGQNAQLTEIPDNFRNIRARATICVPGEKGKFTKHPFRLFSDQWQKLTLDIASPDLLKDAPLRLFPLNTTGIVTLSNVKIVDKVSDKTYWSALEFDDNRFVTVKGTIIRLPSKGCLVSFVTGREAEIGFNVAGIFPDRPMQLEIWIRAIMNPAIYHETLRAFLSHESWAAILETDSGETETTILKLAGNFETTGCFPEADAAYQKGLQKYPESESLHMGFAESAMKRRAWVEAIKRWQDVAALKGKDTPAYVYKQLNAAYDNQNLFPKGSPEEEATRGDGDKHELLSLVHHILAPGLYFEIGVDEGKSLSLAGCPAIGIDPMPRVKASLLEEARIVEMTSDDFFKGPATDLLRQPPDLVFIDGLHFFEFVLRDFMNVERFSASWTLVVIDDIFPAHPAQAERRRKTRNWTGDVWKLYMVLKKYRPSLFFLPINSSPTGLLLIAGLDPDSNVLWEKYDEIVSRYASDIKPPADVLSREGTLPSKHGIVPRVLGVLKDSRNLYLSTETLIHNLEKEVSSLGVDVKNGKYTNA